MSKLSSISIVASSNESVKPKLALRDSAYLSIRHIFVAELSFGFWTTLLGRRLEHPLWIRGLRRAFPRVRLVSGISPSRSVVADRFGFLREFRNRIAHHEPIFSRALEADHHSLLEVAGWMFPDLGEWTATISPCIALLSAGPSKLESS